MRCPDKLVEQGQDLGLTKKEAEDIFKEIQGVMKDAFAAGDVFGSAQGKRLAEQIRAEFEVGNEEGAYWIAAEAAYERAYNTKQNQLKRAFNQLIRDTRNEADVKSANSAGYSANERLKNILLDMEGYATGRARLWMAELDEGLKEYQGAVGYKFTEDQAHNLYKEIWALTHNDASGKTNDAAAVKLAKIWVKISDERINELNTRGADITDRADWITKQVHNRFKTETFGLSNTEKMKLYNPIGKTEKDALLNKARDGWVDFVYNRLNLDDWYDANTGIPHSEKYIRDKLADIHRAIVTNGYSSAAEYGKMFNNSSLAERLGRGRKLNFKNADAAFEVMKETGQNDIFRSMESVILRDSRSLALLETLGPNPVSGFNKLHDYSKNLDKQSGIKPDSRFTENNNELHFREFAELNEIADAGIAKLMQGFRNWAVATKLGSMLLSQLNDTVNFQTLARLDGFGAGDSIRFMTKMLTVGKDTRGQARSLGVGVTAMHAMMAARYGDGIQGIGFSAKAADTVIRLSGGQLWTDISKAGYEALIGHYTHKYADKAYAELSAEYKSMLDRYGITEKEWNIIRSSESFTFPDGDQMKTPIGVKGAKPTTESIEASVKYARMLADEANTAIVSPGTRERAIMLQGTKAGSLSGEIMRNMALFHTFSVSMATKVWPRIFNAENMKDKKSIMFGWAMGMLVTGALSLQLKEMVKGRDPRDMYTPDFWIAAMAQAGGAGILGDYMFQDYSRFGQSLGSTIMGPVVGNVSDILGATIGNTYKIARGKETDFLSDLVKLGKNNMPGNNLFYSRLALDRLMFDQLSEYTNPGSLARSEKKLYGERGQSYWWRPGETTPDRFIDLGAIKGGR